MGQRRGQTRGTAKWLTLLSVTMLAASAFALGPASRAGATAPAFVPHPLPSGLGVTFLANGPDGNLWFTANDANKIARATTAGVVTEFAIPTSGAQPHGIVAGSDGNLWFTERDGNKIGRITPAGVITEFPIPTSGAQPHGIVAGPDGNLWFVETGANQVGRITTAGVVTEFPIPTAGSAPFSIAAGSDGNLWFTATGAAKVGRITPAGVITEFPLPSGHSSTFIITAGPDGNLWATSGGSHLARVTTAGVVTMFPVDTPGSGPNFVAPGPDGNLWVSQIISGFRVSTVTTSGDVTEHSFPYGLPGPFATDDDGELWVGSSTHLTRIHLDPIPTGEFTSLDPARILDTRTTNGGHAGKVAPGETFEVQVTGRGGVPAGGVGAVVMNVTVTEPTGSGFLTVWPSGVARPVVSNLNFVPGQTVPNLVTVKVGADGRLNVYNHTGSTRVVMDVAGFYSDASGPLGARFHGLSPARMLDTRAGAALGPGATRALGVTGVGGVPNDVGVSGVVMNVTVTEPTGFGFLTVWPSGMTRPDASNLNFTPGLTAPNLVTVRVPANGVVNLFNSAGVTHVVVDVVGYYDDDKSTEAGRFVPVTPQRMVDTRVASPYPPPGKMLPNTSLFVLPAARPWLPASGMGSLVANVTVTEPTAAGFVTAYPGDQPIPPTSSLNFMPGDTRPNLVVVRLATGFPPPPITQLPGYMAFFNNAGSTHLVVDVAGFFTDATAPPPPPPAVTGAAGPTDVGPGMPFAAPSAGSDGVLPMG